MAVARTIGVVVFSLDKIHVFHVIFFIILWSKTAGDGDLQVLEDILIPAYYKVPEGLSQVPSLVMFDLSTVMC